MEIGAQRGHEAMFSVFFFCYGLSENLQDSLVFFHIVMM